MKKISELMLEIGFHKDGSEATKEAFIKHLIYVSTGTRVTTPSEKAEILNNPDKVKSFPQIKDQMTFDFMDEVVKKKKA